MEFSSVSCVYVHSSVFSLQEFLDLQLRGWEYQYFALWGEKRRERKNRINKYRILSPIVLQSDSLASPFLHALWVS